MTTHDGYVVHCSDGPAEGYEYWTAIAPDETIILQAGPTDTFKWIRMPSGTTEIPGTPLHRYRREDLDDYTETDATGSLVIAYHATEDGA